MHEKPDGKTWEEFLFDGGKVNDDEERNGEFASTMAEQARTAIEECDDLDADRYRLDVNEESGRVTVYADGWEMEMEDSAHLRDSLSAMGIGDKSVAVLCNSRWRDSKGPNPLPDDIPRGVQVKTWRAVDRQDEVTEMVAGAFGVEGHSE